MSASDCNVCLTTDDSCGTEFFAKRISHSIKQRECCECGKAIQVGESYEYASGKSDGEFWNCSTCLICAEIAETFYCDGRMFGGMLWEEMQEHAFDEMNTGCLERLQTAAAKEFLLKKWNEWKFR